jgi:hypothetical protein
VLHHLFELNCELIFLSRFYVAAALFTLSDAVE